MLFAITSIGRRQIEEIPHREDFELWTRRLSNEQLQAIRDDLNRRVGGGEVHTSSWIPGSDWTDTVFQPIYEIASGYDPIAAARCFGLILWHVMMIRPENWSFGRYEKDGVPIEGLTYFRIDCVFLLGEDRRRKADHQACQGK